MTVSALQEQKVSRAAGRMCDWYCVTITRSPSDVQRTVNKERDFPSTVVKSDEGSKTLSLC